MYLKQQKINVILHPPKDKKSLDTLQEIIDEFYAKLIERDMSKYNLTYEEKEYILKQVATKLG